MSKKRDTSIGGVALAVGIAIGGAAVPPKDPPLQKPPIVTQDTQNDISTVKVVGDGDTKKVQIEKKRNGETIQTKTYDAQYVANALAACDKYEKTTGIEAAKRPQWEAMEKALKKAGAALPAPK